MVGVGVRADLGDVDHRDRRDAGRALCITAAGRPVFVTIIVTLFIGAILRVCSF